MPKIPSYLIVETGYRGHAVAAITGPKGAISLDSPLILSEAEAWRRKVLEKCASFAFILQMDSSPDRAFASAHVPSVFGTEAPSIIAQQQTAEVMRSLQDSLKNSPQLAALESHSYNLDPLSLRWQRPSITFQKEVTFHWETAVVVLHHKPSCNSGACWAHLPESNILFVGDAISVTLPPPLLNAKIGPWLESLADLRHAPFKNCRVFCSHGGWLDSDQISSFTRFLQNAQRKIELLKEKDSAQKEIPGIARTLCEHFPVPTDRKDFALRRLQLHLQAIWEEGHSSAGEKSAAE